MTKAAQAQPRRLAELEADIARATRNFAESARRAGVALNEIHARDLWKGDRYKSWRQYCLMRFGLDPAMVLMFRRIATKWPTGPLPDRRAAVLRYLLQAPEAAQKELEPQLKKMSVRELKTRVIELKTREIGGDRTEKPTPVAVYDTRQGLARDKQGEPRPPREWRRITDAPTLVHIPTSPVDVTCVRRALEHELTEALLEEARNEIFRLRTALREQAGAAST